MQLRRNVSFVFSVNKDFLMFKYFPISNSTATRVRETSKTIQTMELSKRQAV